MQKTQNIHNISTHWTNQDAETPPTLSFTLYTRTFCSLHNFCSVHVDRQAYIQDEQNIHGKTQQQVNPHQNSRQKYYINVDLLKRGFPLTTSWRLKKILRVSTLSSNAKHCRRHFGDHTVFHHVWPGRFTTTAYETLLQRRWKAWHWDSLVVRARWCSSTLSSCSSTVLEQLVSRISYRTMWCSSPWQHLQPTVCATALATADIECGSQGLYSQSGNVLRWTVYRGVVLYFRNATRVDSTETAV